MRCLLAARLLVERHAPLDGGGLRCGVGARHALHVLLGHPGPLAQVVQVHLRHALAHGFQAVHPLVAEVLVVELLVADDLQHGHGQRAVAAGTHAQPVLAGAGREPRELRVHHGHLHAALHEVGDPMAVEAVCVAVEGLVAPHDAVLWHRVARIVVALGEELRAVHDAGAAQHAGHRRDAGQVARVAGEVGHALVRGAHTGVQARYLVDIAARALAHGDLVGAVRVDDALELAHDDVVGLVPADLHELVLAAVGAVALHRFGQAVLMVDVVGDAEAAAAQASLVVGVLRVALHFHQLAVLHVGQDAAHVVASRRAARGAADDGHAVLLPRPRHFRRLGSRHGWARVGLLRQARAAAVLLPVGLAPVLLHGGLG